MCPYHAWTYDYDGTLKFAPGMKKSKKFHKNEIRLKPLHVSLFHGFVFVSVHSNPSPLKTCLGDLPKHLSDWFGINGKAKDMVCAGRKEYDVACNWKFLMENTCETCKSFTCIYDVQYLVLFTYLFLYFNHFN